jgi:hypothetical protein
LKAWGAAAQVHHLGNGRGGGGLLGCASMSACLFAVHPVHTEAVTGTVGRAELLSALFLLGALRSYLKGRWWAALALTELAHGCKETGLLTFLLFVWLEVTSPPLLRPPPSARWPGRLWIRASTRCLASVVLFGLHVLLRVYLLEGVTTPAFTYMDNPLWFADNLTAQVLGTMQVHWQYTRLLLWPAQLSCDYSPKCLEECTDPGVCLVKPLAAYAAAVLLVAWACWLRSRRRHPSDAAWECMPLFALGWVAVTIAPGSHVFLKVGLLVAERLLYVPSMGVCMLCGWVATTSMEVVMSAAEGGGGHHPLLIGRGERRSPSAAANGAHPSRPSNRGGAAQRRVPHHAVVGAVGCILAAVVGMGAWRCVTRNEDWRDADTLYAAALQVCPHSARINNNVGTRLLRRNQAREAIRYFDAAVAAVPHFALALHNRGLASYLLGEKLKAVEWFRRSLLTPDRSNGMAHNNMGIALRDLGRAKEAQQSFRRAKALGHSA